MAHSIIFRRIFLTPSKMPQYSLKPWTVPSESRPISWKEIEVQIYPWRPNAVDLGWYLGTEPEAKNAISQNANKSHFGVKMIPGFTVTYSSP